jgi:hypothetical protein
MNTPGAKLSGGLDYPALIVDQLPVADLGLT